MGDVFCLFLLETFLVQVCAELKNQLFFFLNCFSTNMYQNKNACHLENEVQNGCIKDHSIGTAERGVGVYRIGRQPWGPDGILRLLVFCFLVKEERHVN